jgi:hypothetical protein
MYEWIDYLDIRWSTYSIIIEKILYNSDSDQWLELYEIPDKTEKAIQVICKEILPIKTKSVKCIELILEHSIIASINSQLLIITSHFDFCVTNAVYSCFNRIHGSPIFKQIIEEYRLIWMAIRKIQFCWRRCIANPSYTTCKKRLLREYNEEITLMQASIQICV